MSDFQTVEVGSSVSLDARRSGDFRVAFAFRRRGVPLDLTAKTLTLVIAESFSFETTTFSGTMSVAANASAEASLTVPRDTVRAWPDGPLAFYIYASGGGHEELVRGTIALLDGHPVAAPVADVPAYVPLNIDYGTRRSTDLEARQSETLKLYLQLFEDGLPFPLTGWTTRLIAHPSQGHSTELTDQTLTVDSAAAGKLSLSVARATIAAIAAGDWTYNLVGTHVTLGDREFQRGKFSVVKGAWS